MNALIEWAKSTEAISLGFIVMLMLAAAAGYNLYWIQNLTAKVPQNTKRSKQNHEQIEAIEDDVDRLIEVKRFDTCKNAEEGTYVWGKLNCSEFNLSNRRRSVN